MNILTKPLAVKQVGTLELQMVILMESLETVVELTVFSLCLLLVLQAMVQLVLT